MTEPATAAPGHATSDARRTGAVRRAPGGPGGTGSADPTWRGDAWRKRLEILVFVTPALALIALFVAWPIVTAVRFSVYDWKGFGDLTDFVGLENYAEVLGDEVFRSAVGHNLVIVVGSILLQLPLGVAIALLLNRRMAGQGLLRTVIFVPYVLAEVIAAVVWLQLLQPQYGFIDAFTAQIGLTPPEQGWLGTPEYALWIVLLVLTWKYLGLAVLLFLAGMQGIAEELYEAAQLDGASWWQTQRQITIPLLGPTMRTWAFLSMIGSIQCFDMIWVLTQGGPADATATMATYLIDEGTKRHNYGIAGAASVILFVIAFAMALAYQVLILRRDVSDDAPRTKRKAVA
ncbi:carbohydrate ABC transporter permease [Nocardioides sp. NPDC051685]|uniref:carbohydrate ABC transporter permease n=1 Tax=Nocardioides sp. NPDC051685 TaxID=3364334 RepID=UPI00379F6515